MRPPAYSFCKLQTLPFQEVTTTRSDLATMAKWWSSRTQLAATGKIRVVEVLSLSVCNTFLLQIPEKVSTVRDSAFSYKTLAKILSSISAKKEVHHYV